MTPVSAGAQTWARARPTCAVGLRRKIHGHTHRWEMRARIAEEIFVGMDGTLSESRAGVKEPDLARQYPSSELLPAVPMSKSTDLPAP